MSLSKFALTPSEENIVSGMDASFNIIYIEWITTLVQQLLV